MDETEREEIEDYSYIESELPEYLKESIKAFRIGYYKQFGKEYYPFDLDYEQLSADINTAEADDIITHKQANFLRSKYLQREMEWNW